MKKISSPTSALIVKLTLVAVISLLMLIPISMIKSQIFEREYAVKESINDIESIWGLPQLVSGPYLQFDYVTITKNSEGKDVKEAQRKIVYPQDLNFDVDAKTQMLHRSIYDVTVYTSEIDIKGSYVIPSELQDLKKAKIMMNLSDLRGIVGLVAINFDGETYEFAAGSGKDNIVAEVQVLPTNPSSRASEILSTQEQNRAVEFTMVLKLKGSEELKFRPIGNVTTVTMRADCSTPSFDGDFLPIEREIKDDSFSAKWEISQINRGEPESTSFGVRMLQPVTQYQQTERSVKYAILIILLVFMASLLVEFLSKSEINVVQYAIVGLSLVLFYSLLLAFSEFMAYGYSYLIAAGMTVIALTFYFRAILKNKSAYILGVLVACAYGVSYMLLQMETYAFLCGTLILFVLLSVLMYFTRNIHIRREDHTDEQ